MQQALPGGDRILVDFPFHSLRNISCPEDNDNGRKVLFGHAPATSILDLPTDENVRDYLLEAEGRKRRQPTQVHRAIRDTLDNTPHNFSVLNGGVSMVARDYKVDDKEKVLRLLKPSIINGSQTKGILKDYYRDMKENSDTPPPIHVTFELIVTEDDALIAETSIARNFQNDVMAVSIAGRLGQLKELEKSVQRKFPEYKLRQSETQLSDYYIATERLIQVMTALIPEKLWLKPGESGNPNKTYTYAMKTKCLKDFQDVYNKAKEDSEDPELAKYKKLYQFYLDIAPQAYELHEKWKRHQGFKGTRLRAIHRDEAGNIKEIPDGIIFPILAALSAFTEETPVGWKIIEPAAFSDEEIISAAITVYQEIADHNPQTMGKNKACYSQLYQLTSLYKRLSQ